MLLAILMTNTDESEFAQAHPKDGEKFTTLLHEVRPNWEFEIFNMKDDEFPDEIGRFNGFLITGSPASVHDGMQWIARLEELIRTLHRQNKPIYGCCFGHQVIATALGGAVEYNPQGWVLGTVVSQLLGDNGPEPINLYAAHKEQVTKAPKDATVIADTPGCPIAGFAIGNHIATTQYHPEMTPDFIKALLDELAGEIEKGVIEGAELTLAKKADRTKISHSIVQFFEDAQA